MSATEKITEILEEKGLKQSDLCCHLNIRNSTFTNWKKRNTDPPSKFIIPICEFIGVSPEYLLTGSESKPYAVTADEKYLLELFRQLGESDRGRIIGRMEAMTER